MSNITSTAAGGGPEPNVNLFKDNDLVWVQDGDKKFPGLITKQNPDNTYDIQYNTEPHPDVPINNISEFNLAVGDDVIVLNEEEDKFADDNFKHGTISDIKLDNTNEKNIDKEDKYDVTYDDNTSEKDVRLQHLAETAVNSEINTDTQALIDKGLFRSDFFTGIVTEFDRMGSESVTDLARERVELDTQDKIVEYILSPDKQVNTYPYAPRNLDWYFKRFLAGDYKENKLNWSEITKIVDKDVIIRNNLFIKLDNDIEKRQFASLLDFYNYINGLAINVKNGLAQIPNGFNTQDIVDMFFSVSSQAFSAPFLLDFGIDYTIASSEYLAIPIQTKETEIITKPLYSFLYGNIANNGPIYNTATKNIEWSSKIPMGARVGKYVASGFKLVVLDLQMNLETRDVNLVVTYHEPFGLFQQGVYIGQTESKIENNGREQEITIIANGQGVFYIYDFKTVGAFPRAKIYGSFSNDSLKKGRLVGIEFYYSQADFDAKTFLNDGEKAGGVMSTLARQKFDGTILVPDDIKLDNIDLDYLLLINKKSLLSPLESENLFDVNGYFMKYTIGPYYTTDQAKYNANPFKISDVFDLPTDFKGKFQSTLINNRQNNSDLPITIESKKGKTTYDILGFMFFPTSIDIITNNPLPTLFSNYFMEKVSKDVTRGQAFAINQNGKEYKETKTYWAQHTAENIDFYKNWLRNKLPNTDFKNEIERENYINAIFYSSQQFMDIIGNYFHSEQLPYQPLGNEFMNMFYTNGKIISIGRKYFLGMTVDPDPNNTLFDDYLTKFHTPICGTLTTTVEYNLKDGVAKMSITPVWQTYFKGEGRNDSMGGKYVGQTLKQKVSNDGVVIDNFIPNGKGIMYFYLADKHDPENDKLGFLDKQLTMTLETDAWSNGNLLKGAKVVINYIDNLNQNPKYKGRTYKIELTQPFLFDTILDDVSQIISGINTEIVNYETKISEIREERASIKAVEDAVKNGHYLKADNRLGDKSHQGIVLFATNTEYYVYIGPILPENDNTVSISKKYGKILQFDKALGLNVKPVDPKVSDKKYTVFIKSGREKSRDWDKFVLKPNFSQNYSDPAQLPLQWQMIRFGSAYDNLKFSLTNNSIGEQGKGTASQIVTRVFADLMTDPLANDLSLTKGLFEDKQRIFKMEKMIYIQVLIYFKILFVFLKRYEGNLDNLGAEYFSMKPLLNELYEDYNNFTQFNSEVSDEYKYDMTNALPNDAIDTELTTAPVSTLLWPIISSMEPKTNASVFDPINQTIDNPELLTVYVLKASLLVLQNLSIVLQMYMNIIGRMPVDEDDNMVLNYNPFILFPMFQKIVSVYNRLYPMYQKQYRDLTPDLAAKINDDVKLNRNLEKINSATINKYLVTLALRLGVSSSLMYRGGYMSRKNKQNQIHKHKFSKRISNLNSKMSIGKQTRHYRHYENENKNKNKNKNDYTRKL